MGISDYIVFCYLFFIYYNFVMIEKERNDKTSRVIFLFHVNTSIYLGATFCEICYFV